MACEIELRKIKLRNITVLYETYLNALNEENKSWTNILLEQNDHSFKLSFQRALSIHILGMLYSRLSAVSRTGSVLAFFQTRWNPVVLEVLVHGKVIGCIFLLRQSEIVFQLIVFESIPSGRHEWSDSKVLTSLKSYLKGLGIKRIIIKAIEEKTKKRLQTSDFEVAFSDNVLQLDIDECT